jgi:hypothetical protein
MPAVGQSKFQQSLLEHRQQFVEHQTNSSVPDLLIADLSKF